MMTILEIVLIFVIVCVTSIIINGIEDYHRVNSLIRLSFADTMGGLNLPIVTLTNNGQTFKFLIDTGATLSVIDSVVLDKLEYLKLDTQGNAYGIDGNIVKVSYARIELTHENTKFTDEFQIMRLDAFDNLRETDNIDLAGILGSTFLNKYNFTIDFNKLIIYTDMDKSSRSK